MTTALATIEQEASDVLTQYEITTAQIAAFKAECADLEATTPAGYELVRSAIARARTARTTVERTRKALKAEHLERGRKIDAVARALTEAVEEIEGPLQAKKEAADAEKERIRREKAEAELVAREAEMKAQREAEEARLRAEREVEEARIAAERAAHEAQKAEFAKRQEEADRKRAEEQAKLDADRAALAEQQRVIDEQKAAAARAEADRLARIKAEDDARAREEAERQAKIRAEDEARAEAERKRLAAEQAARDEAEAAARLEALKPDIEKVRGWAVAFRELAAAAPEVASPEAIVPIKWAQEKAEFVASALEKFTPKGGK